MIVGTAIDSTGVEVTIKYADAIAGTIIVPLLMKNFLKLIEDGQGSNFVTYNNKSKAVYIEIDNKIVGHIVFEYRPDDVLKTSWIILSWVDEQYRRRGLYKILHTAFEKIIKTAGSKRIASFVKMDNLARLHSCESVGMRKNCFRMEKDLE